MARQASGVRKRRPSYANSLCSTNQLIRAPPCPVPQIGQSPSPWLSDQTVQPGPSRFTIETFCFGTGAQSADFSIFPDAVSRPRMQHRPSSTQSEAEPIKRQRDTVDGCPDPHLSSRSLRQIDNQTAGELPNGRHCSCALRRQGRRRKIELAREHRPRGNDACIVCRFCPVIARYTGSLMVTGRPMIMTRTVRSFEQHARPSASDAMPSCPSYHSMRRGCRLPARGRHALPRSGAPQASVSSRRH
ncbi:MAG: hypothetical protein QOD93_2781 [Acetobacteraceae bacterium]|jgi:hypothetical protein|nr:hypothetical protein [Acetobacteraceae bacterium]